ncbi:helicase-related protein, partial [Aphanothece sacrum]|uniref:helicase-related protein n=1 Tax=Aphanothece sacrum TaxID=1122 RepID=UPI000F61E18F
NLDLRNAHQELIKRELESEKTYLFLTGNPGIGKTTAITEFLKQEKILKEGFLFIYVSPRIQVNLDILEKFTNKTTNQLCDDQIFTITTNSNLIKRNGGKITVNYCSNEYTKDRFINQNVHFINQRSEELDFEYSNSSRIFRQTEDTVIDTGQRNKGVLLSLSQAINTIISQEISNNIVATVAMQSYKKTKKCDTLSHLENIFSSAYNSSTEKVIDNEMKKISQRIKHIFFMLDEITGDESGVHFLDRINKIFKKFNLINNSYGFNAKIIIADASIVNPEVINQHLSDISPEPNKIFFRKVNSNALPLSLQEFEFKNKQATIINTNSYPATSLNITYKVLIESIKFDEQVHFHKENKLKEKAQNQIIDDIQRLLKEHPDEQIIVYIQDKARLQKLINNIKELQKFDYQHHYLEIHANLSDTDKKEIYQHLNKPTLKVIFMTASASRGLSFPKVKHILVEIPRFEVEKNLMEVIQVIYRGRGDNDIDQQDKQLIFYLAEQAIYDAEEDKKNRQLAIQESVLSLINLLLILKTSIMTRIMGSGKIGKYDFMMIPIGGKSVSAAGETFSSKMNNLIKQLKKEYRKQSNYKQLEKVYNYLEYLLKECDITLNNLIKSQEKAGVSYLDIRSDSSDTFLELIERSFDNLLNYLPLEKSHISGSLLVVPIIGKTLEERYRIQPDKNSSKLSYEQLIESLQNLLDAKTLPENIKSGIGDAIDFINIIFDKADRTQNFEQDSQDEDQYYAIPLFAFISAEIMEQYFANNEEESAEYTFRDILNTYIRSLYPVTNMLPIGNQYQEFPFIVFRSYGLNEIRSKLFTDKYFLNSNEINILTLILSAKND